MDFQLGIWTHAYQWTDSPHSSHHIVGLTPETHATYCRDALAMLLKACPQITGLTMRIHGESGIPEGSYPFWQTLFDAIPAARTPDGKPRVIEIDMHAKGLNQIMIDMARKTGMPVKAGAKFWAEHLGLGYQQADIRANEYPREGVTGTFAVSSGARNFTRYGYGDFYQFRKASDPARASTSSIESGPAPSVTCSGATPHSPQDTAAQPTSAEPPASNSWSRSSSKAAKVPANPAAATPTPIRLSASPHRSPTKLSS